MTDEFVRSALPRYGRVPRDLLRDPDISDRAVRLYGLLDDYAGADARPFPKRQTLADAMGCSLSAVARTLRELSESGWIVREPRFREDRSQTSSLTSLLASPRVTGDTPPASPVTHQEGEPLKETPLKPPKGGERARREVADNDPAWEEFWRAYPRKTGKGAARRAWLPALDKVAATNPTDPPAVVLVAAARRYAATITELRYAAHPGTWLRGERWLDDLDGLRQGGHTPDPNRRVNWRKGMPECPIHSGQHRDACPGCAADAKAAR